MTLQQTPAPDSYLLRWKGDELVVTLALDAPRKGRAVLRTNLANNGGDDTVAAVTAMGYDAYFFALAAMHPL